MLLSKDPEPWNGKQESDMILLVTDGSALGNPGPTGAGAVAYIDGYNCSPILF